jgi:hypothetical protein
MLDPFRRNLARFLLTDTNYLQHCAAPLTQSFGVRAVFSSFLFTGGFSNFVFTAGECPLYPVIVMVIHRHISKTQWVPIITIIFSLFCIAVSFGDVRAYYLESLPLLLGT